MSTNDLKSNKHQKMQKKKCKIKISYSDLHSNKTHLWPGEHRPKS
jgi:hypothetical protein